MATTTNYGWTTPDDTALVKDGASAIRSLGTAIDTTTKNLNPETTLGDISYRSSTANTKTRLAIGTTGQVLTVSGGVPAWATPSGTGKSWTLLNAGGTALTGASTITVSGISGKEDLLIIVINCSSVNANSFIRIEPNGISANYVNAYNFWNPNSTYAAGDFGHTASTAFANITLGALSNSATVFVFLYLCVSLCNCLMSLYVCLSLTVFLSLSFSVYVFFCHVLLCLSISVSLSLSFSVSV